MSYVLKYFAFNYFPSKKYCPLISKFFSIFNPSLSFPFPVKLPERIVTDAVSSLIPPFLFLAHSNLAPCHPSTQNGLAKSNTISLLWNRVCPFQSFTYSTFLLTDDPKFLSWAQNSPEFLIYISSSVLDIFNWVSNPAECSINICWIKNPSPICSSWFRSLFLNLFYPMPSI